MNKGLKFILWGLLGLTVVALFTFVTQQLWNWLVPDLFGGPMITFWQSAGLLILSKILFTGFGKKSHCGHSHGQWKNRFAEKLSNMTPEQREAFKKRMTDKWCSYGEPKGDDTPNSND